MTMTSADAYGPTGDAARHLPLDDLRASFSALAAAPPDAGVLDLVVRRHPDGARDTPDEVRITAEDGVPGDAWFRRTPDNPDAQLTVMNTAVASLVANGQPLTVFGDNLFVDLDLSAANLPVGTSLRLGEAVVVMTPKPHNGCKKFAGRFGADAVRFVQDPSTRHLNLRGVYWRVTVPGVIRPGDRVEVLERGSG